jgi:hypothetical protein
MRAAWIAVMALAIASMPFGARAQTSSTASSSGGAAASTSTVLTTVVPTTTLAGIIYGIYTTVKGKDQPAAAPAAAKAVESYLRSNAVQLAQDLAVGTGPVMKDLAAGAAIRTENMKHFGKVLRNHRTELMELADTAKLNEERTLAFLRRVGDIIKADKTLVVDYEAFMKKNQG